MQDGPLRRLLRGERILPKLLPQGVRGIDSSLEAMKEAKKREWSSRGYPPGLIDKATRMADEWAFSMARTWSPPGRPDVYEAILKTSYPKALETADRWIGIMSAQRY
jgi:hypothetical protein